MSGQEMIFTGIRQDFPPMVTSGLDAGFGVDGANEQGMSPLWMASYLHRSEIMSLLIGRGADLEFKCQQMTPLMATAQEGHVAAARILIEAGANVNASSDDGLTPLMIAIRDGHTAIVEHLLTCRVDLEAKTKQGSDAMDVATQFEQPEIISMLKRAAGLEPGGFIEQLRLRTANIYVDESHTASLNDESESTP